MADAAPLAPKQPEALAPSDYSLAIEPSVKRVKVKFQGGREGTLHTRA